MLYVRWSKWRVILFKLVLLADSAVFFEIGAYYMSNNYLYTSGNDTELDGKIKDFVVYIWAFCAIRRALLKNLRCRSNSRTKIRLPIQGNGGGEKD